MESEYTAADMQEAADSARLAIEAHRAAHASLEASLHGSGSSGGGGGGDGRVFELRTPGRMPAHPTEPTHEALEPSNAAAVLREAVAECKKVLRLAEETFASSRSRIARVSSAMQAAVVAAKRPGGAPTKRGAAAGQFGDAGSRVDWMSKR